MLVTCDTDDRHLRNSMSKVLLAYVRRVVGDIGVQTVCQGAGDERTLDVLEDPDEWSTYDQMCRLFETAAIVVGDPSVGRRVGEDVYMRSRPAPVLDRLRALGHPGEVVRYIAETPARQSQVTHITCLATSTRHAVVASGTAAPFERRRVFCDYLAGVLAGVPTIFGMDPAEVVEVECQRDGAQRCLYVMSWVPRGEVGADVEVELVSKRLDELTTSFAALEEMASQLVSSEDRSLALQTIAERAATRVDAERYLLAVRLPSENEVRVHAIGFAPDASEAMSAQLLAGEIPGGPDCCLTVEIASASHIFGVLAAFEPKAGRFLPEERRLLAAYAGHAAAVLDAAAALASARERAQTMSALFQLARELGEVTTPEDVAWRLARSLPAVADCDGVGVYLWDDAAGRLALTAQSNRESLVSLPGSSPVVVDDAGTAELVRAMTDATAPRTISHSTTDPVLSRLLELAGVSCPEDRVEMVPIAAHKVCFGLAVLVDRADGQRLANLERSSMRNERLPGVSSLAATALHNARLVDDIQHQALQDPLTGLANRAVVLDRLEQAMAQLSGEPTPVTVMSVGIDGFKQINDAYGHAIGDTILKELGRRLSHEVVVPSSLGRFGGDTFIVSFTGDLIASGAELVATWLLDAVCQPYELAELDGTDRSSLSVTASIGIAIGQGISAAELVRDAGVAMHVAKTAGHDRVVVYVPEMREAVSIRLDLDTDLRTAIAQSQFHLVYQPTVDLSDGTITGVEALIRWTHPERGPVYPDEFIPALEQSGLITAVGRWVLREACRQAVEWDSRGHRLTMAVNLSARQLESPVIISEVRTALTESGLDPARLVLELTESALARDPSSMQPQLAALRALGVRVAIDDFGTGYSSFAHLDEFDVDILKIDRSFVMKIAAGDEANSVIHTIIQLARDFGLEVVAEGIEEPHQLELLRAERCDIGQGYLFSRPLQPEDLEILVAGQRVTTKTSIAPARAPRALAAAS